jgi:hypothetical protein
MNIHTLAPDRFSLLFHSELCFRVPLCLPTGLFFLAAVLHVQIMPMAVYAPSLGSSGYFPGSASIVWYKYVSGFTS